MENDKQFITQEYFDLMILRGVNDFAGLYLNDLKAMGLDFSGAYFNKTNLNGVDFRQSKFSRHSTFQDCYMNDVIFRRCDLSYLRFCSDSILRGQFHNALMITTQFKDCDLGNSIFDGANIRACVFRDCDLRGCDFSRAFSLEETKFAGCNLEGANFGKQSGFIIE